MSSLFRFERTGHTSYFLLDNYIQLLLVLVAWTAVGLVSLLAKKWKGLKSKQETTYFVLHKVHEIAVFYVVIGVMLEFMFFEFQSSVLSWMSFAFSLLAILYFAGYNFFIFYKLIRYPKINAATQVFADYATKYGYFLDDIRYAEYRQIEWSFRHMFRPYNFRMLGYYRRILIVAAMPLFHNYRLAQVSFLVIV